MARSFRDFNDGGSDKSLCPRCHANPKEGAVNIRLNEFQEGHSSKYNQVSSRQVSMCEECSVEVYEGLVETLNEETNGGTRPARNANSREPSKATRSTTRVGKSSARGRRRVR